ncbi:hypothetical protein [Synechococcus sp. MIT S9451]|uniref:hypothetical protein n=1 Tax=Synechococcus sp. MIT S9451 TaxID=3082543 RepID=UPI0039B4DE52
MSFKYFRPTLRKVTTTQKAPAYKNTASAERLADLIDATDILSNHSIEKHLAEVNFEDHGHSILKESGLTRGHSIIETSFGDQLAGRDSILGGAGKQNESQFSESGLRGSGAFGKGMASSPENSPTRNAETVAEVVLSTDDGIAGKFSTVISVVSALTKDTAHERNQGLVGVVGSGIVGGPAGVVAEKIGTEIEKKIASKALEDIEILKEGICGVYGLPDCVISEERNPGSRIQTEQEMRNTPSPWNPANQCTEDSTNNGTNDGRPAPDDDGGSEGGFMTWKLQDQLSNGFKNAKDPITNPYNENQGGGILTATELQEMEADLRNAKDPATNWGDENYNNVISAIDLNVGELSLKDPCTNWGDNNSGPFPNHVNGATGEPVGGPVVDPMD